METFEAINTRVSIREYQTKPVDKHLIEKIIDAARRAPTARKVEPWEFIAVTQKDILEKLGSIADHGPFIKNAACCIAIFCKDTKYYLEDGCAATQNLLLAATDLGLGACWVAGDKKSYAKDVSKILKMPDGFRLVSLIPVGWPIRKIEQQKTRKLEEVLHWNTAG